MIRMLLAGFTAAAALHAPICFAQMDKSETLRVLDLGNRLYLHDQAAWHATDAFREMIPEGYDLASLQGYVVTPTDQGALRVAFHAQEGESRLVLWEGLVRGSEVLESKWLENPRELSPAETARVKAVVTGLPVVTGACKGRTPMNTAVLDAPDGLYVYYLTPMKSMDEVVFGRHFRATVSSDGAAYRDGRGFTKTCAISPTRNAEGHPVEALISTHLLDAHPQETHVFASLQHDIEIYVITSDKTLYAVRGDRIRVVDPD